MLSESLDRSLSLGSKQPPTTAVEPEATLSRWSTARQSKGLGTCCRIQVEAAESLLHAILIDRHRIRLAARLALQRDHVITQPRQQIGARRPLNTRACKFLNGLSSAPTHQYF